MFFLMKYKDISIGLATNICHFVLFVPQILLYLTSHMISIHLEGTAKKKKKKRNIESSSFAGITTCREIL